MNVRGLSFRVLVSLCAVAGTLSWCASAPAAGGGSGLIDGRSWEMVSPVDKHGAGIVPIGQGIIQASEDGSGIAYVAGAPVSADPEGHGWYYSQVLSRRGPGGWSSRDIGVPQEASTGVLNEGSVSEYFLFSSDLSAGFVEPPSEAPVPYLRDSATGDYLPLVTSANTPNEKLGSFLFAGASPDLRHVVIDYSASSSDLYEWAGGQVTPIAGGAELGSNRDVRHAVSNDGSRIVWSRSAGGLYQIDLFDAARGETVRVDAVQSGTGSGEPHSVYQTASADGSRIFFTDSQQLTADSTAEIGRPDLYVFEVTGGGGPLSGTVTDLTVDGNGGEHADVLGLISGASEDGSYVYFFANGALAPGAVHGTCPIAYGGFEESCNLYVEHRGPGGWEAPRFIAVVSGSNYNWEGPLEEVSKLATRVSPDGRYMTFVTDRSPTGYDNRDALSGERDTEVYLYDVSTGRLVCASCSPSGARPTGVFDAGSSNPPLVDGFESFGNRWMSGTLPSWSTRGALIYQSRFLSDSGRLFFNSSDALVPGDVNGKEDVYEFEPLGVGGCQSTTQGTTAVYVADDGGCVGLISSGTSDEESAFLDASASGGDVFLVSSADLVPQDTDGAFDVYDAHECTAGSPCLDSGTAVASPPCATADGCRGALSLPGAFGVPGSATLTGAGNIAPAPAIGGKPAPKRKPKSLTRSQRLARALKACSRKPKKQRAVCGRRAHKAFGARTSTAGKATARSGR